MNTRKEAWLFIAPFGVLFLVFILAPILSIYVFSLYDWNLVGGHHPVGLTNYREVILDREFWRAFQNTLIYGVAVVPLTIGVGLVLALGLNRQMPARSFLRASFYVPFVISSVVSATTASWIFNDHYGVINAMLASLGLPRILWLSSTTFAMPALMITTVWVRAGFCMVIYLAALQDIPTDLYEAANLDGANRWHQFRSVTWPLLRPASIFLLVANVIYSFHVFDLVYIMTGGGPAFSTTVLVQYLYQAGFEMQRQGYAATISVLLFSIILLTIGLPWLWSRRKSKAA